MYKIVKKIYKKFRKPLGKLYRFGTLKIIYPMTYRIKSRKKINPNKVIFIEVRSEKLTDDFELLYGKLKKKKQFEIHTHFLRMGFARKKDYIRLCMALVRDIADAKYVFISDASDVLACLPLRSDTIVTQMWHACGAFKKFGMSTADLIFGDNRKSLKKYPYHKNYTHVTVSAKEIVWAYEEAMSLTEQPGVVKPIGVSRTDVFFDDVYLEKAKKQVLRVVPQAKEKKIILYAPTFRGRVASAKTPDVLDLFYMQRMLGDSYIVLFKHHPFVKKRPEIPEELKDFAVDVTDTLSIESLLCTSDVCISDYSSLVFEYSLFERPMIFFAYDLDEYYDWRGFYYDYKTFVPGPILTDTEQIVDYIKKVEEAFDKSVVRKFRETYMGACDGHATERIMKLVFGEAIE